MRLPLLLAHPQMQCRISRPRRFPLLTGLPSPARFLLRSRYLVLDHTRLKASKPTISKRLMMHFSQMSDDTWPMRSGRNFLKAPGYL